MSVKFDAGPVVALGVGVGVMAAGLNMAFPKHDTERDRGTDIGNVVAREVIRMVAGNELDRIQQELGRAAASAIMDALR